MNSLAAGDSLYMNAVSRRLIKKISMEDIRNIFVMISGKAGEESYSTGVLTYCLTMDPDADAFVKRIFDENNYTIGDNVDRLSEKFPTLFASLTG